MMIALYVYDNHSAVSLFLLIVLFIFQWLQCPRKVVIASALLSVLCVYLLAETNKHNKTVLLAESSSFTGEISSVPHSDGDKLTFKFTVQNEEVMAFYKLKTLEEKQQLEKLTIHQVCQLGGQLTSPSPARNLHAFDYQQYLYHQSIHWQLNVKGLDLVKCQLPTLTPLTYLTFIRQKGINYIQQNMSDPGAGFMQALINLWRAHWHRRREYQALSAIWFNPLACHIRSSCWTADSDVFLFAHSDWNNARASHYAFTFASSCIHGFGRWQRFSCPSCFYEYADAYIDKNTKKNSFG